jgi:rod shape-determining protein MreC
MPAEICNNTLKFHNNYLTIDKGTKHGIKKSMGVVGDNGIVGIVRNVSGRFAQVLSILNEQIRISVIIKNKNYLGNLTWNGTDPTRMIVNAIPKHSLISLGDTIITSGYSSIFLKGIEIGTVERFWVHESNGNDYNIIVKLFINMNNLSSCYVIDNTLLNEQKSVEKE